MSKPLNENLQHVRAETEQGDLLPIMEAAGHQFAELISAVTAYQKLGTLTLKITARPSTAGALAVKADISLKKPQGLPHEALLWATPEGNLIAEDPRQGKLPIKELPQAAPRSLKAVA